MRRAAKANQHVYERNELSLGASHPAILGSSRPHIPFVSGAGGLDTLSVTRDNGQQPARAHLAEGLARGLDAASFAPAWRGVVITSPTAFFGPYVTWPRDANAGRMPR